MLRSILHRATIFIGSLVAVVALIAVTPASISAHSHPWNPGDITAYQDLPDRPRPDEPGRGNDPPPRPDDGQAPPGRPPSPDPEPGPGRGRGGGSPKRTPPEPAVWKQGTVVQTRVGEPVTFLLTVTNHGQETAEDVVVTTNTPTFLERMNAQTTWGYITTDQHSTRFVLGSVNPGDTIQITFYARVIGTPMPSNNNLTFTLSSATQDTNLLNNVATYVVWAR